LIINDLRKSASKVQANVAFRDAAGRCVSDNRLGGNAAPTDFAGDVLDELLWFDESFFLPEAVTFPWSAAFTCRCWN